MEQKLWFKAKKYGWGWYPSSWQGWSIIFLYSLGIGLYFKNIDTYSHSASDTLIGLIVPVSIQTIFLLVICYVKGEKPGWHWGSADKKE